MMYYSRSSLLLSLLSLLALSSFARAHLVINYPGWRGDSLFTNGTVNDTNGLAEGTLKNGSTVYPFGMQWLYPCGGTPLSTNRTLWPVTGGAVSLQPGWFTGHLNAVLYINLGEGTNPVNMSLPMLPATGIIGPTNNAYPYSDVCFPQLPLPANYNATIGGNATIQVIMLAQHGAALYSCVDITFADPLDVAQVNQSNCANSSDIQFTQIFATTSLTSAAPAPISGPLVTILSSVPMLMALAISLL